MTKGQPAILVAAYLCDPVLRLLFINNDPGATQQRKFAGQMHDQ